MVVFVVDSGPVDSTRLCADVTDVRLRAVYRGGVGLDATYFQIQNSSGENLPDQTIFLPPGAFSAL